MSSLDEFDHRYCATCEAQQLQITRLNGELAKARAEVTHLIGCADAATGIAESYHAEVARLKTGLVELRAKVGAPRADFFGAQMIGARGVLDAIDALLGKEP